MRDAIVEVAGNVIVVGHVEGGEAEVQGNENKTVD